MLIDKQASQHKLFQYFRGLEHIHNDLILDFP